MKNSDSSPCYIRWNLRNSYLSFLKIISFSLLLMHSVLHFVMVQQQIYVKDSVILHLIFKQQDN